MPVDHQTNWKFPIAPAIAALTGEDIGFVAYRTGRSKIRCPFHDDTRPSATIDWDKQRFRCFTCGVNGDSVDLFQDQEGLTRAQARDRAEAVSGTGHLDVPGRAGPRSVSLFD